MLDRNDRVINTLIENDLIVVTNTIFALVASVEECQEFGITEEDLKRLELI